MFVTMGTFLSPLLFVLVFIVFHTSAKTLALKKMVKNSLDNKETLLSATLTKNENGVYNCHHGSHADHHRQRRYTASTFKFHTMVVLWYVAKFSAKLPKDVQLSIFEEAFDKWHAASRLNFSYTDDETKANIKISFLSNYFNDGPGGTLAHASQPNPDHPSEIIFDEDEHWVTNATEGGTNLLAVALHDIGHAIGIRHSSAPLSIMRETILNNNTELYPDDIAAIRWMYGKCEVRDLTAVLHDRFGFVDTLLVINNNKVWRIWAHSGEIFNEEHEKWPKDVREYYKAQDRSYDRVFPLRAAFFAQGDNDVYLFGQDHFIRRKPYNDYNLTHGRFYEFKEIMDWKRQYSRWVLVPEGPLPYSPMNIYHTPDFFKYFLNSDAKFGAAFEIGCCYWQHFFMNGTHYKVSMHNFNNFLIEDMSVNFPGAPRNPDAAWYDMVNSEWYFFKEDKYYKWDANVRTFTNRGPISLLWFSVCD